MAESSKDIRLRGHISGTGGLSSRFWDELAKPFGQYQRGTEPARRPSRAERYRDRDGNPLYNSTYALDVDTMNYLYPKSGDRTGLHHCFKRLGIPYNPKFRGFTQRGEYVTIDEDVIEELDQLDAVQTIRTTDYEPTTWVLDAEHLATSFLMNGDPNPDSLTWSLDPYESAWASVGLILGDEAFKHVSIYIIGKVNRQ